MVVTCLPCTSEIGMTHVRVGAPSMCIVQAPQSPTPQPNLLPVRPRCSRTTHNRGTSSGPSKSADIPLTENFTMLGSLSRRDLQTLSVLASLPGLTPQVGFTR